MTIKAILGYDIDPAFSEDEYENWLRDIHIPDLFANPFLDQIVFNTVIGSVRGEESFYRISELHFKDMDEYEQFCDWRKEHPVDSYRGPDGKTSFRFYVYCESEVVTRSPDLDV